MKTMGFHVSAMDTQQVLPLFLRYGLYEEFNLYAVIE